MAHRLVAAVLILAGAIHLALTPEHFAESVLFGAVFVAIAALQLAVAYRLWGRPGPATYRLAVAASGGIVALWAATRLIGPPTGSGPEEIEFWGVFATGLELAAVALLAATTPSLGRPSRNPWLAGLGIGAAFAVVFLLASGAMGAGQAARGSPLVDAYTIEGDLSVTFPALAVLVDGGRVFLTLPWSVGLFLPIASGLIAYQVRTPFSCPAARSDSGPGGAASRQPCPRSSPPLSAAARRSSRSSAWAGSWPWRRSHRGFLSRPVCCSQWEQ